MFLFCFFFIYIICCGTVLAAYFKNFWFSTIVIFVLLIVLCGFIFIFTFVFLYIFLIFWDIGPTCETDLYFGTSLFFVVFLFHFLIYLFIYYYFFEYFQVVSNINLTHVMLSHYIYFFCRICFLLLECF